MFSPFISPTPPTPSPSQLTPAHKTKPLYSFIYTIIHHQQVSMFEPLPALHDPEDDLRSLMDDLAESLQRTKLTTDALRPQELAAEVEAAQEQDKTSQQPKKRKQRFNSGLLKKITYTVDSESGPIEVDSWKFKEFDYTRDEVVFPIRARGLFTRNGKIIVRGYDKFFNVDETQESKLEVLQKLHGPFSASTKENGCIILIAGLEDGTLMVCSKHSTGKNSKTGFIAKHCVEGRKAVLEHLEKKGKSPKELARKLYEMNATAMLELCDDNFEEHILRYPQGVAGLYLHGINLNVREFRTYPIDKVAEFADEWGFRKVEYTIFEEFDLLWQFLESMKTKGLYNGRELEGFVVRSRENGVERFFKYKFDEPYYLYRQLREVTIKLIDETRPVPIPQIMLSVTKHRKITFDYLLFAKLEFEKNEELVQLYRDSIGIIGMREKYMAAKGITSGMTLLEMDNDALLSDNLAQLIKETRVHVVILPIAVQAAGKTTIFKTLTTLFPGWKMAQRDDYDPFEEFFSQVLQNINESEVLIVDMTFHKQVTRIDFFNKIAEERDGKILPDIAIKFVAINFFPDSISIDVERVLKQRLAGRGDNHQSFRIEGNEERANNILDAYLADLTPPKCLKREIVYNPQGSTASTHPPYVVEGKNFAYPDNKFDDIVQVEISESETASLDIAKTILNVLEARFLDISSREISNDEWKDAFEQAKAYKPIHRKKMTKQKDPRRAEYFGIGISDPSKLKEMVDGALQNDASWQNLKELDRVQGEFHVTLGHVFSTKRRDDSPPSFDPFLNRIPPERVSSADVLVESVSESTANETIVKDNLTGCSVSKKKRIQKKTSEPNALATEKTNSSEQAKRWQHLALVFDVSKLKKDARPNKRSRADQVCDVQVDKVVVVENRLVALKVRISDPFENVNGRWVQQQSPLQPMNRYLHITMGTFPGIAPKESNTYLTKLYEAHNDLPEGEYNIDGDTIRVTDVDFNFPKQSAFVHFQNFKP